MLYQVNNSYHIGQRLQLTMLHKILVFINHNYTIEIRIDYNTRYNTLLNVVRILNVKWGIKESNIMLY